MRNTFVLIAIALTVLCSCSLNSVWHPVAPLVTLHDIHGLFGGHELLIDQSGQLWERKVDGAQRETRHFLKLTDTELADLMRSIRTSGILRYREKPFSPGPCMTKIKITVSLPGKATLTAEMWDHFDRAWDEPNFTRFNLHLRSLCSRAESQPAYHAGHYSSQCPLP